MIIVPNINTRCKNNQYFCDNYKKKLYLYENGLKHSNVSWKKSLYFFVRIVEHTKILRDEIRNFCENHMKYGNKRFK
jgi:hypothetical protein